MKAKAMLSDCLSIYVIQLTDACNKLIPLVLVRYVCIVVGYGVSE